MTKICSKCKKELPITEFYKENNTKDGLYCYCKKCSQKLSYKNRQEQIIKNPNYYKENNQRFYKLHPNYHHSVHFIYYKLKQNTEKRKQKFNLNEIVFKNWYNNQEKKCYYCGRTLKEIRQDIRETKRNQGRMSIDRKNNNKGYEINNIVLACNRCNTIKSYFFTEQEMLEIGKIIQNTIQRRSEK